MPPPTSRYDASADIYSLLISASNKSDTAIDAINFKKKLRLLTPPICTLVPPPASPLLPFFFTNA